MEGPPTIEDIKRTVDFAVKHFSALDRCVTNRLRIVAPNVSCEDFIMIAWDKEKVYMPQAVFLWCKYNNK